MGSSQLFQTCDSMSLHSVQRIVAIFAHRMSAKKLEVTEGQLAMQSDDAKKDAVPIQVVRRKTMKSWS
jgi:hypothetical protein